MAASYNRLGVKDIRLDDETAETGVIVSLLSTHPRCCTRTAVLTQKETGQEASPPD